MAFHHLLHRKITDCDPLLFSHFRRQLTPEALQFLDYGETNVPLIGRGDDARRLAGQEFDPYTLRRASEASIVGEWDVYDGIDAAPLP